MVISNNQLLLSMENFHLLKIDLMNPTKPTEIDLNPYFVPIKAPNRPVICGLFIDNSGQHCLITVGQRIKNNPSMDVIPFENFYYYRKLSLLNKMKGHIITAVGWLDQPQHQQSGQCGNLLIGTSEGKIFETHLQSDDRFLASRELSFWKLICDFSPTIAATAANLDYSSSNLSNSSMDPNKTSSSSSSSVATANTIAVKQEPICAIKLFRLKNREFCILIATRNLIYQYIGRISPSTTTQLIGGINSGTFADMSTGVGNGQLIDGQPYLYQIIQGPNSQKTFKEMPGYIPATRLDLFRPTISTNMDNNYPLSFGWLTEPGIFYGDIPSDFGYKERKIFDNATVIMYSDLNQPLSDSEHSRESSNHLHHHRSIPQSLVLTRFHLMLLYPHKLRVYCVLNRQLVWEDRFVGEPGENLVKDPIRNTIWSYTKSSVYRYRINQEDRNIWEIYLKKKDFEQAKHFARNDLIKMDRIICEEALYHFAHKK